MNACLTNVDPIRLGGRFELLDLLGRGSSGTVFRARDHQRDRDVALKVLTARTADPTRANSQFLREAELLARVDHPNVVKVYSYGTDGDQAWVAMELVKGRSLAEFVEARTLSTPQILDVMIEVAMGVGAAHEAGLVHRDLKPANILVGTDGVRVVDFGLAKEVGDAVSMTGDGLMLGTPLYMAPEQIRGLPLDRRCDVYAFGASLYEALAGRPPFVRPQSAAVLMAHLNEPIPPMRTFLADGPPPAACLEAVVQRCLAKHRADRFQNLDEVGALLHACSAALGDPARSSVIVASLEQGASQPRRPGAIARLGLPLLVAAGILVFGNVIVEGVDAVREANALLTAPPPPVPESPAESEQPVTEVGLTPAADRPREAPTGVVEALPSADPPRPSRTRDALQGQTPGAEPVTPAAPAPTPSPEHASPRASLRYRGSDLKNPFANVERP